MSHAANPILELPFGTLPDPDAYIQAAMAWHFDPETGSPFWLERAKTLDFDPRADVKSHADLALFPNVTDEIRDVPAASFIPKGYGSKSQVLAIIESGGTTGAPKALPLMADFAQLMVDRDVYIFEHYGLTHEKNWLLFSPSGPHGALEQARRGARAYGVLPFAIDMDPRWVKKEIGAGKQAEADAYAEHLLDQALFIMRGQNIGYIRLTPPILSRICRHDEWVDLIRENVSYIHWGGASMDADTRHFYMDEMFPGMTLAGSYGTTMALGSGGAQRFGAEDANETIFDPTLSPYTTFEVRDANTGERVEYGQRGQLVVNHVSKALLLPNNAERDAVTRIAPVNPNQIGDSIADIAPLVEFKGQKVIEGVY
ncbi:phenazine antibiotic biosynthesis protein [Novosphingobium flavum]|uniref:Phenazine antibiotic biosynthesis protein n=1 Tax=Novosphingobium flavum TaxID=1778672 RepID=A0A7X1FUP7_9SPHN|nr:phenazine antibiotic biosynthesis protein [Novosphingobium flavum]MBC2666682.1 phenazine antibiotic biosynthesis protein [Novosphingobium flavum]